MRITEQIRRREKKALLYAIAAVAAMLTAIAAAAPAYAQVKPGDVITPANAQQVQNLLSPGNYVLVQRGMQLNIVTTSSTDWPPPYKSATEKYHAQVALGSDGTLQHYTAGLPFPLLDPNDPQVAEKVMWNFSFRPLYTDDADLRYPEIASYTPTSAPGSPTGYFTVGHFAFYNNVGRIEVPPVPTDPDAQASGVRYRFAFYPFLEPATLRGLGFLRFRHLDPNIEDNIWVYSSHSRRLRREQASLMSDAIGAIPGFGSGAAQPYVSTIDPDSYFGFSAKIEDFNYRLLGEKDMLACVHAKSSPEPSCSTDGGHTICPEDWEMRHLYVIEAIAKNGSNAAIPKRIFYIDSEGWFITASDQYDREGKLWKTLATFNTYRDRPVPDARVAIYPYKRMFQLGLADEDIEQNASSVIYMPGPTAPERECWYIDMGVVDNSFLSPESITNAGH
ncbi:MAG: DUF1329 domain-containing protein [Candidatus Binataceae bacterium]